MAIITYGASEPNPKGVVNAGGGLSFDIGAALAAGGGQFTIDSSANGPLASVLDSNPGLVRLNTVPGTVVYANKVALVSGNPADDLYPLSAGTGQRMATNLNEVAVLGSDGTMTLTQPVPGATTLTLDGRPDNHYNDVVLSIYSQRAGRGITIQDDCGIFTPGYVVAGNPTWPAINQVGFMIGGQSDVVSPTFLSEINRTANPGSTHFQAQTNLTGNAPGFVIGGEQSPLLWWGAGTTGAASDTSLGRTAAGKLSIGNSAAAVNGLGLAGGSTVYSGSGAPAAGLGANGDFYLRGDTPGTANTRIYVKSAGAWTGIL